MRLPFSLIVMSLAASPCVFADAIPYPHAGTIAPQVVTYASSSGGVNVYFDGSGASFNDYVRVFDVQTGYNSGDILNNHVTPLGTEVTVGSAAGQINAGDQLVFYIDSPDGLFASVASYSADGVNHGYVTTYSGGMIGGTSVPNGLYVGLEDLPLGISDFNYTDDTFVFTGVSAPAISAAPEPGSLLLTGTGALAVASVLRRRLTRQA